MGGIHRDGVMTKLTTYTGPTDSSFYNPFFDHATGEGRELPFAPRRSRGAPRVYAGSLNPCRASSFQPPSCFCQT